MKWTRRIAAIVAAVLLIAVLAVYAFLRGSLPDTTGTIRVAGVAAPVEIIRDRHGVPHIFAASAADAYFALGFVHAQDRLAQMDFMRLTALGRLAEFIGPAGLDSDRFMRLLDIAGQAAANLAEVSPATRATLDAYSAGVNAFLAARPGPLPPEFALVGREPENWRPEDSLLWGELMVLQLSGNWRDELNRARFADRLTPAMMGELWPNFPADGATTLQHLATLYGTLGLDRLAAALPQMEATGASNGWALAGQHTASAKPMLVNDTHLGLNAPDIWYLARLSAPGLDLVGATAPGVPAVILGHNRSFAWGFTTTTVDQFDLFVERLDPADANRYLTPDGPREFARRGATIKVKGAPDQGLTVRATRHGPVLSELTPAIAAVAPSGHVAALAGPALLGPNRTVEAMFAVNRAHDLGEFTAALADWQAPMQNIFYVDVAGNIGFFVPGRVPRRKTGDGFLPQPGWTGEADWIGVVPPAELPRALNPPSGRIVNANNRVVPDDYKYFISRDWDSPYRAARIGERLAPLARADAAAMETILADPVSRFARAALPGMLRVPPADSRSRRALQLLAAWDGAMRRERPEPLIFSAWTRQLTRDLLAEVLGKDGDQVLREAPRLILAALDGSSAFCKAEAKRCGEAASRALARALADLARIHGDNIARWRWGNAHFAPFRHPVFGRVPLLRDVVGFRVATDGDFFTVNRGAGRIVDAAYPFAHVHGATYRAIYDLADLDASRFIVAPGQSGHPLSRHWGDLAQPWANGRHITIAGTQKQLRRSGSVLTLAP